MMKATMEIPDDLYRQVKAKSALEGRPVRAVAIELFRRYVEESKPPDLVRGQRDNRRLFDNEPPAWYGILRPLAKKVLRHDMPAIRKSIARGISSDRGL